MVEKLCFLLETRKGFSISDNLVQYKRFSSEELFETFVYSLREDSHPWNPLDMLTFILMEGKINQAQLVVIIEL